MFKGAGLEASGRIGTPAGVPSRTSSGPPGGSVFERQDDQPLAATAVQLDAGGDETRDEVAASAAQLLTQLVVLPVGTHPVLPDCAQGIVDSVSQSQYRKRERPI